MDVVIMGCGEITGAVAQELAREGGVRLVVADRDETRARELAARTGVSRFVSASAIGYYGYAAPDVFIADGYALADPVGARLLLPPPEVRRTRSSGSAAVSSTPPWRPPRTTSTCATSTT